MIDISAFVRLVPPPIPPAPRYSGSKAVTAVLTEGRPDKLHFSQQWRGMFMLLILPILLVGCTNSRPSLSPVDNRTQVVGKIPSYYSVRTGDSLYMIAMEYDLNYLKLAQWNGIRAPYTIHRGERLRLSPEKKEGSKRAKSAPKKRHRGNLYTVQRGDTLSEIAKRLGVQTHQLARWNQLTKPYTIRVGEQLRRKPASRSQQKVASKRRDSVTTKTVSTPKRRATREHRRSPPTNGSSSSRLRRPVSGKVAKRFSKKRGMTGVEFKGRKGDPVRAAADGKVVYSGTGLVRYGKLLIIKHENNLLTAYAHNSQLQVSEGDVVKTGQQIAKMGRSGTDRVKLHFEVRKGGKPVDPMRYLSR
jgi:lipoprotein NlpD